MAVASSESAQIENAIVIFRADSILPKLEWKYPTPEAYALYSFSRWDGEDRIKLGLTMWVGPEIKDIGTEVVRTGAGWQLKLPPGGYTRGPTAATPPPK